MLISRLTNNVPPKMVIFDLGGTLVDSLPDLTRALNQVLESRQAGRVTHELVREWIGSGARQMMQHAFAHHQLSCSDIDDAVNEFKQIYHRGCHIDSRLYEGVEHCLEHLSSLDIVIALVTNKPREIVPSILSSQGIDHFFSIVITEDDLPERKPSPLPLLSCLQRTGFSPQQVLMVGDSHNDIYAARQSGISVVMVDYGYGYYDQCDHYQPDHVVSSLAKLCV